jgi:hypothetical protein
MWIIPLGYADSVRTTMVQADRQIRCYYWIIRCGRLGLGKDVQAITISNVSYSYIGRADDSAFAICAAMFQNRYVVYGLNTMADQ